MATEPEKTDLHEYAGGWITEKKGTEIPFFLKLAYPIIIVALLIYIVVYMNGEIHHETRGPLVQQLNAVTGSANSFMYMVAGLIVVYALILLAFVYKKSDHEE